MQADLWNIFAILMDQKVTFTTVQLLVLCILGFVVYISFNLHNFCKHLNYMTFMNSDRDQMVNVRFQYTAGQTWTFIPFRMWDKNTTVPKRAAHSHFDWTSDGSCRSQALSQLSVKLAQLLAGTIYSWQLTTYFIQCTVHSCWVVSLFQLVHISHRAELSWITDSHQLLLVGNTLPAECGGGRGGREGGWADILQLLLILTPGKAKHQVKKKKLWQI